MKVLRLHGPGDLRLPDEPTPVPGPDEVLVRVTAVGICGSDLHWYAEGGIGSDHLVNPVVLGHEAGGVIESGPEKGTRVAIDPAIPCHGCDACEAGRYHLCRRIRFAGDGYVEGFLREVIAWPRHALVPVPDSLSDADVAQLEPLGVALHALRLAPVLPGDRVGVFGAGPIGQFIIQLARSAGARTILATDVLPHRIEAAKAAGATHVMAPAGGAERAELLEATDGAGVDVAFEAAGEDDSLETSLRLTRPAGTVVVVGIPHVDSFTFPASVARRKGLTIKMSRRMNRVYPETIRIAQQGLADLRSMVTGDYPLDRADDAFRAAVARKGSKIVLRP
jgi:L-iditol 2-dehydrogenase